MLDCKNSCSDCVHRRYLVHRGNGEVIGEYVCVAAPVRTEVAQNDFVRGQASHGIDFQRTLEDLCANINGTEMTARFNYPADVLNRFPEYRKYPSALKPFLALVQPDYSDGGSGMLSITESVSLPIGKVALAYWKCWALNGDGRCPQFRHQDTEEEDRRIVEKDQMLGLGSCPDGIPLESTEIISSVAVTGMILALIVASFLVGYFSAPVN